MRTQTRTHLLASLLVAASAAVRAADPPPPATATTPPAASAPVAEVVVKGERLAVETTIDRKIYTIANDLQSTSGSAADVLRNLPSVSVDIDGNPSLRGDSSVTILIDGRLAPEFNGPNRGVALQQLGADNIDRIEVLTNPPANFKRDGSGGIINIITKRKPGARSASVQASLGSNERYNLGGRQARQVGKLNLRGSAAVRHEPRERDFQDYRVTRDGFGTILDERRTHTVDEADQLTKSLSLGADLDMTPADRLTLEGSYLRRDTGSSLVESTTEYTRTRRGDPYQYDSSAQLRYHHKGERDGDGLTMNAERSESVSTGALRFDKSFIVPGQPDIVQGYGYADDQVTDELSVEYVVTQANDRKLIAGYDLSHDAYLLARSQSLPANAGDVLLPDPGFTNTFRYTQTIHALYGSYEMPFDKWTTLAGLRLEHAAVLSQRYFRAYPSLHVSRKLTERQTLKFSYSRRVFRPGGSDLNPFRIQINEYSQRSGNPNLEPSDFDSLEAGWSYDQGRTSRSVTLYARRSNNARTSITTLISPTVTLVVPENLGKTLASGLELAAAGRIGPSVDYNLSGNLFYNEIDASNLGFAGSRSNYSADGKAALNWRMSDKDTIQINANALGRRVTPQGTRAGVASMDLGYRHQFRPNISLSATLTDVFASRKFVSIMESPELSQRGTFRPDGRILFVGLSWSMAGAKKQAPDRFEYEQ